MSQRDREKLAVLKDLENKHCKQREAALRLELSVRQVQRLVSAYKAKGDEAVVHGLAGSESNRKIDEEIQKRAVELLRGEDCLGFGPTYASEYLADKHKIEASRETVRQWMRKAGLWKAGRRRAGRCINGGKGEAGSGNWCSGTPVSMTGWRDEVPSCI
ncbi:MAG: hypothetical protein SFV51_28965 [Bryobacteraceae bacterium]|nr:hypothetical protein [Bryobacteraceae bacterium]